MPLSLFWRASLFFGSFLEPVGMKHFGIRVKMECEKCFSLSNQMEQIHIDLLVKQYFDQD